MVDAVVLADTHLRSGIEVLDPRLLRALGGTDVILHAGDFVSSQVLEDLGQLAEVYGVLGNNDHGLDGVLPSALAVEIGGVAVSMVHDGGRSARRADRLARQFPGAQLVVFGHSHIPVNQLGVGGQMLFNPGSPTQRRTQPHRTYGRLTLEDGRILRHRIVTLE